MLNADLTREDCWLGNKKGRITHLMRNVGSRVADIAVHLAHDTNVFVAVEERVFVLALHAHAARTATVRGFVGLEAGIGEHYDEPLGILVARSDRDILFGDELGEGGRRKRLGTCSCGHFVKMLVPSNDSTMAGRGSV